MQFFIPDLRDDPEAAEARWQSYAERSGAAASSRRIFSVTYEHESSRFVVTVGERRMEFRRQTGPRGGYIKNAPYLGYGHDSGTIVSAILDCAELLQVWTYGPPFKGWANPSLIGRREVSDVTYFDP
jgi:hypothetical protein